MNSSMLLWDRLKKNRLVALLSPQRAGDCVTAYEALNPLGVVLEVALRTQAALEGIREVKQRYPNALIMAGTVMTRHQAECVIDAGVAGVVSPDYIPIVVEVCAREDVMCIPGGLTDVGKQLVQKAQLYNCELDELRMHVPYQWVYKLFPALVGGTVHLEMAKAWRPIYKDLLIEYTGGITLENLAEVIRRDPGGVVCASALTRNVNNPQQLKADVESWLEILRMGPAAAPPAAVGGAVPIGGVPPSAPAQPLQEERFIRVEERVAWVEDRVNQVEDRVQDLEKKDEAKAEAARAVEDMAGFDVSAFKRKAEPSAFAVTGNAVATFGEIMLRLSPPKGLRFGQSAGFDVSFGGAEANVAVALANYGMASRYVTVLPEHSMGQAAVNALRSYGVDTRHVLRRGQRMGIYYMEHGVSQRPSRVIYDRQGSAVSGIEPGQVDWASVFDGARWFHWSGITPALSDSAAAVMLEALKAAERAGVVVSVDLNYRAKLWPREKACEVMTVLMQYVDVAIGNEADASEVFGIQAAGSDVLAGRLDTGAYQNVSRQLVERFGLKMAAITLRESITASDNVWSACLYDGKEFYHSKKYPIHIEDRVGGGDAFTAGLIYGLLSGKRHGEALEFAVAASCLKHTMQGDFNLSSVQEVEALMGGDTAGRIKR